MNSPGAGWSFKPSAAWFPAGWNSAYTYTNCVSVLTLLTLGAGLSAYYAASTPVNVALAGGGSSCAAPAAAGAPLSSNSGSPTALGQSGDGTFFYYVVVQPTVAVTSNQTVTVTFKVSGTTASVAITLSPGTAIAVTIAPPSTTFSEDVVTPGAGWAFNNSATWFPTGWNGAYTYTNGGNCLSVTVTTSVQGWNLTTYYAVNPSTPMNIALAQAGTGNCAAPGAAGTPISANSASPTTVLSSQSGTQTVTYYVIVQPTVAVTSSVTVTETFTAQ